MSTALHLGREARISGAGFGAVLALHGLVLWALLQMQLITLPAPLAVLSVSLLPPAEIARPEPEVVQPKPRPVEKRPTPQAVTQPAPLALQADATVAAPIATPVAVSPAPTFAAPATLALAAPALAAPAPSAPRFDADYLDNPKPAYPGLSRKLGEQGRVVLRVHVDAAGLPLEVQIASGSGFARLDHAALETVRRWKFVPARLGKEAVAATVLVPIAFSLKD